MKLTILGSGTGHPSAKRAPAGCLIETGSSKMLFDSGPGTFLRLAKINISVADLTHLFYTHLHPDHTLDFMFFLFASRNPGLQRTLPLHVAGPEGFLEFYEKAKILYGNWMEVPFKFLLKEMLEDVQPFDDFSVQSTEVLHQKHSVAYAVTDQNGKKFVYTGDMDKNDAIVRLAKGADVFLCECSFPDDHYCPGHMTPSSVAEIAEKSGVKKIVLTHFYPVWDSVSFKDALSPLKGMNVVTAEDFMEIQI